MSFKTRMSEIYKATILFSSFHFVNLVILVIYKTSLNDLISYTTRNLRFTTTAQKYRPKYFFFSSGSSVVDVMRFGLLISLPKFLHSKMIGVLHAYECNLYPLLHSKYAQSYFRKFKLVNHDTEIVIHLAEHYKDIC